MRVRPKTLAQARSLRKRMTLPEVLLWQALRKRSFPNFRFRRQVPIGPYVADFACLQAAVILEVDGMAHEHEQAVIHDTRRDAYLRERGFQVVRIAARDVLRDLNGLLDGLGAWLQETRGDKASPHRPAGAAPQHAEGRVPPSPADAGEE